MRRVLIAGNWKMNMLSADGTALAAAVAAGSGPQPSCDLLICPPATLLHAVLDTVGKTALPDRPVSVGGQDCHADASGAHTGDIAAEMLADLGCSHVIVGHSERRAGHGERDAEVRAKAEAAHRAGLVAIVCVGETEAERDAGQAHTVAAGQIEGSLPEGATATNTVVAYEPVWAIGTGKSATPDDVAGMHRHIRGLLPEADAMRILYGGSVKPGNAAELLALEDVDGALIGGASLKAEDFLAIAATAA